MNHFCFPARRCGEYRVIDLYGQVNDSDSLIGLKRQLEECLLNGEHHIALNLERIDTLHSYFIKIIAVTYKKVRLKKGRLCLVGPNDFIRNLMHILTLEEFIPIYNRESDFLATLAEPR